MAAFIQSLFLCRRGAGFLALVLLLFAQHANAQSELGNYCVQDYMPGAVCTAHDVRIAEFQVVETIEACGAVTPGMARVRLRAFVSSEGAPARYDIGLFMATDGDSAMSGDSCLHDYFSGGLSASPTYGDFNGDGVDDLSSPPWQTNEDEADTCGDIRADSQLFKEMDVVVIPCRDADADGMVDVSACATWDNNESSGSENSPHCSSVNHSWPGTSSKCGCDEVVAVVGLAAGAIALTKLPATQTIDYGASAHFTLTATNPTLVDLTNVVLDDPRCTTLSASSGDTNGNAVLESTETWTWDCTTTNVQANFTNVGTVTALGNGQSVTDQATADVIVTPAPPQAGAIELTKLPATQTIDHGSSAQFTLTATNPTTVDLTNVVLDDPRCTTLSAPSGDTNGNAVLESTETWTWGCITANVQANFTNVGTVNALANGQPVTDQATADVIIAPEPPTGGAIELTKLPPTQTVNHGTSAHFTLTATNPTAVDLTNVVLDDPRCTTLSAPGGDTNGNAVLEPTETWTWGCITTNVQASFTNVGTVTALANGQSVTDQATADVVVTLPPDGNAGIDIEKLLQSLTHDPQTGVWTIRVRLDVANIGTFDLTNVIVTDALSAGAGGDFGAFTNETPTLAGTYSVSGVVAQGLAADPDFNGDAGLTTVASGALAVGATAWAEFTIMMIPTAEGSFVNQARVIGTGPDGPTEDEDTIGFPIALGQTAPQSIPVDAKWALLLLVLGTLLLGARRLGA